MEVWYPGKKLPAYQSVIDELTATVYECHRTGDDERLITFEPTGEIGMGQCEHELYWDVRIQEGVLWLDVCAENYITFSVSIADNGLWRGKYWSFGNREVLLKPRNARYHKKITKGARTFSNTIIHVRLSGQLGNCLRNIASVSILAGHVDADWDIDFNQSHTPTNVCLVLAALFPDKIRWYNVSAYISFDEKRLLQFTDIYGTNSDPVVEAVVSEVPSFHFGIRHIYAFRPNNMSIEEYVQKKIGFYKNICWPENFREQARSFFATIEGNKIAGCHIRYTDNLTDGLKSQLGLNTPLHVFIKKLAGLKNITVLLCTDNEDVKRLIKQRLPFLPLCFPNKYDGEELWQPLYEMFLLSQTSYIIGSYSSTFSYEACFIKGINIELYKNGQWTLYPVI